MQTLHVHTLYIRYSVVSQEQYFASCIVRLCCGKVLFEWFTHHVICKHLQQQVTVNKNPHHACCSSHSSCEFYLFFLWLFPSLQYLSTGRGSWAPRGLSPKKTSISSNNRLCFEFAICCHVHPKYIYVER